MLNQFQSYEAIKSWKDEHISKNLSDTITLNTFHDTIMLKVFDLALVLLNKGTPPCHFSWFITGSGGRFEQGLISDQDHGIVFKSSDNNSKEFFKALGEELSYGLNIVGYPYCEGKIMSSNPMWCKPVDLWKKQLFQWMEEGSWQSIRNLQIFFDTRSLVGDSSLITTLKDFIFEYKESNHFLIKRLTDNVMHVKSAVGPLGQIIVEEKGIHAGAIDLKYSAFLPYVNAIRLLALKEGITQTSTLDRFEQLINEKGYGDTLDLYQKNFQRLLQYRLSIINPEDSYDDIHYLTINKLNREEKKEIKRILKDGKKLHQYVIELIEKGC